MAAVSGHVASSVQDGGVSVRPRVFGPAVNVILGIPVGINPSEATISQAR